MKKELTVHYRHIDFPVIVYGKFFQISRKIILEYGFFFQATCTVLYIAKYKLFCTQYCMFCSNVKMNV